MKPKLLTSFLLSLLLSTHIALCSPPREFYEDQIAEESIDNEEYAGYQSFAYPKLFNDGKPFVVEKDPVTGTIDFNTKKTVSSPTSYKESENSRVDINQIAPNIHDFLNLPVKYSSAKSVYPLISSSYSNLKYQGNNKQYISNHKNFTTSTTTTTSPKYYSSSVFANSTPETKPTTTSTTVTTTTLSTPTTPSTTVGEASTKPTFKFDTKYKYQDSAMIRKKVNITTTTTSKPSKVSYPLPSKLNVIPLSSTKTPTTTPTPARVTYSYVDSSKVRFPGSTKFAASPTPTRSTPAPPTVRITTTKKVPSLTDLFSLWGNDEDDEYVEEENTVVPEDRPPSFTFADPPPSMLPMNFSSLTPTTTKTHQTVAPLQTQQLQPSEASKTPDFKKVPEPISSKAPSTVTPATTKATKPTETTKIRFPEAPKTSETPKTTQAPTTSAASKTTTTSKATKPSTLEFTVTQDFATKPQDFATKPQDFAKTSLELSKLWTIPVSEATERPSESPVIEQQEIHEVPEIMKTSDDLPEFVPQQIPQRADFFPQNIRRPQFSDSVPAANSHEQNYVSYGGAPMRNTFVISPEQDSASFVLGSQSVVGGQSSPHSGHFVGSAIQDSYSPYEQKVPGQVINDIRPENTPQGFSVKVQNSAPVRFPGGLPTDNEVAGNDPQIIRGTIPGDMSPQQMNSELTKIVSDVIFKEHEDSHLGELLPPPQDLTPPVDGQYEAPQFFERPGPSPPKYIYDNRRPNRPQVQRVDRRPLQRLPLNERPQGSNRPPRPQLQYRIDSVPMPTKLIRNQPDRLMMSERPELGPIERPLPNILPQFRPNVKGVPKQRPPPQARRPPPGFVIRRTQPPSLPQVTRISAGPYQEFSPNRRHYSPPSYSQMTLTPPQKYFDPSHPVFQRHISVNANPMVQQEYLHAAPVQRVSQAPDHLLHGISQVMLQDYGANQAPQFQTLQIQGEARNENKFPEKEPKLEPVVTLQQIQAKRLKEMRDKEQKVEGPKLKEVVPEVPVTVETAGQKPVYVVYPMKGQEEANLEGLENGIVIASRGEQGVAAPVTTEYQNTPFSVVSHFEQEPLLTVKEKSKKPAAAFPYALERPSEQEVPPNHRPLDAIIYNTGEQPISSTLTRVTTTTGPIAYAYTPSPRPINANGPHIHDAANHEVYSMPNIAAQVVTNEATEHNRFVEDYDSDRVREQFQAPFYASANLPNKVTPHSTVEGWAIVTPPPQQQLGGGVHFDTNTIDRSDKGVDDSQRIEVTTKKFDPETFKPEFLSGFQPIQSTLVSKPAAPSSFPTVADIHVKHPTSIPPPPPPTTKKPSFNPFGSLEAFFDALTKDYDAPDEDHETTSKSS